VRFSEICCACKGRDDELGEESMGERGSGGMGGRRNSRSLSDCCRWIRRKTGTDEGKTRGVKQADAGIRESDNRGAREFRRRPNSDVPAVLRRAR